MSSENNMPEQTMNNIKNLQNLEKQLYINLEKESKDNNQDRQAEIIKQINNISQTRINMFQQLNSIYRLLDRNLENDRNNLENQMTTLSIVEKNLNHSKQQFNKMRDNNANTLRMTEIDNFFSSKYNAYTKVLQFLILLLIPVVIIVVLKRNQTISLQTTNVFISIIIIVGLFYIGGTLIDLSRRNNMVFQEYDFPVNVDNGGAGGAPPHDNKDTDNDFDTLGGGLIGECIGAECCSRDMIFNTKKSICEPKVKGKTTSESFVNQCTPLN